MEFAFNPLSFVWGQLENGVWLFVVVECFDEMFYGAWVAEFAELFGDFYAMSNAPVVQLLNERLDGFHNPTRLLEMTIDQCYGFGRAGGQHLTETHGTLKLRVVPGATCWGSSRGG